MTVPVHLLARSVHGLEWVCADEIGDLPDAGQIRFGRREVSFAMASLDTAPLGLRTVDDVFLRVGSGTGDTPDAIAATLAPLPWEERVDDVRGLRAMPPAPVLDVVAAVEGHRFNRFAVEHALGPLLAARLGGTYLRRTAAGREPGDPDLTVRVSVRAGDVTAALRLAAQPLHRRAWKHDTGPGTLHPPVAAALARLADPQPGQAVLDPFCGDGTIAIETALAYPSAQVTGRDLNVDRLENATRNAARAGVTLDLDRADAGRPGTAATDVVITNPPWNLAVDGAGSLRTGLDPLWRRLPDLLASDGRVVAITDADLAAPAALTRAGFGLGLVARVRLAGRVSDILLAAPCRAPAVPEPLRGWRERAIAAGVVTAEGF